jgi:YVTN family beta-propeller protein
MTPRFLVLVTCALVAFANAAKAGTSNSLMDVAPDGKLLLVANPDNGTVTVVDTAANKALREIKVGEKPEGVTWLGAGPKAAVTVYRESKVVIVDANEGKVLQSIATEPEPYGIVANKDGSRVWVTNEYPAVVTEIDVAEGKVVRTMKVGPFVRGIALSVDESKLYVTQFYTGALQAVDLKKGAVVDEWKAFAQDNLARHVVLNPRRPKAYLSHIRARIEVADGSGSIFPHLSICDLVPPTDKNPKRRVSLAMDTYNGVYVVTTPWEAAISPDGSRLYTIYSGTNDMNVNRVVDDDYKEIEHLGRVVQLGQNPRAIRTSPDGKKVYVYCAMDFAVTVHDADMRQLEKITVCAPPKSPEWVRGKILFNTAKYPLTSRRWIACFSCHPDGHQDNRVWQNPEGLRKTPPLFGLAHTHPLHWSADRDEVQDFEYTIRGRLMQGAGLLRGKMKPKDGFKPTELEEDLAGRSKDLDALAIYTNSFEFTLSPHIAAPGKLTEAAQRGQKLFSSAEVGCATCHSGPYYSDSSLKKPFKVHDVGTGGGDKSEKMGPKYDTPTLLGVYRSAPYLHHGKAATLMDVLTTANKQDKHGKTSHLKPAELEDLVAFLKSLPFEKPPDETPNTVQYRLKPKKE